MYLFLFISFSPPFYFYLFIYLSTLGLSVVGPAAIDDGSNSYTYIKYGQQKAAAGITKHPPPADPPANNGRFSNSKGFLRIVFATNSSNYIFRLQTPSTLGGRMRESFSFFSRFLTHQRRRAAMRSGKQTCTVTLQIEI